jgi:hypothetical protein
MSEFIERLLRVGAISSNPIGFGTNRSSQKPSGMVLVGVLDLEKPRPDLQTLVEYVAIRVSNPTKNKLASAKRMASNLVWGIWSSRLSDKSSASIKQQGGDFYVIPDIDLPASLISSEEIGKVVVVPFDLPEELCQSIGDLPIEAVLVSGLETKLKLTLRDVMTIRVMSDSISKPMVLVRSVSLLETDLSMLQEAGVNGIMLNLECISLEDLEMTRDVLEKLPQRRAKKHVQTSAIAKITTLEANHFDYEDDDNNE